MQPQRWQLQLQTPAQESIDCKCPLRPREKRPTNVGKAPITEGYGLEENRLEEKNI